MILKPTFIQTPQYSFRMATQLSQISFTILLVIQLHPTNKPNPHNPANNHIPFNTLANNISCSEHTSNRTKHRAKQGTNFPTFGTIHAIIEGSNLSFKNKRQRREYYRQVNHVAVEGPIMRTKRSHILITFNEDDIKLVSFLHTDAMVITAHIDKWDIMRVLINNGSRAKILFLSTFE
jgi:hypothetical protein